MRVCVLFYARVSARSSLSCLRVHDLAAAGWRGYLHHTPSLLPPIGLRAYSLIKNMAGKFAGAEAKTSLLDLVTGPGN